MKTAADYDLVHSAIKRMRYSFQNARSSVELDRNERDAVLRLLLDVLDDYVPTECEIEIHQMNIDRLNRLDPERNKTAWNRVMTDIDEFENKYC